MINQRPGSRGSNLRSKNGYPQTCREECPTIGVKRHYCRLAAWHQGEHVSAVGAWDSGDRGIRDRRHPPRRRKS